MAISREKVRDMYQLGAKRYDFTTVLFRLIGLRMKAYRSLAIKKLLLQQGNFVIELGCGTGLNFPFIMEQIGAEGRLIGVDLTPGMLDIARERIRRAGWKNVELIQSDITAYAFPGRVNGVLATGLFGYIPEYDRVINAVSQCLVPGGHLSILDGKQPENLPSWLFKIVLKLGGPFGYTPEYFNVRPWESVERYFKETSIETMYGGMIYISSGTASSSPA
ncbi:MAG: methyltransferase domain-containing protein [Nitrospiraceae bacterium]|jgi:demethylmenaquinone methyltransferase/2-methoxy-6-polyprenyl-1,4-benzoquinol methylase|nr:MAG: methyltransferase domain-containing protein [Nitrospiraceae bacterium]